MKLISFYISAIFFSLLPVFSRASVVMENTRIIYTDSKEGQTVKITNSDPNFYFVQLWSDKGNMNSTPDDASAPFIILPPQFRMAPHSVQTTKLIYSGKPLAQDRESIFYFNLAQIPQVKSESNAIAMVLRDRVKIFYRPPGLAAPGAHELESGVIFTGDSKGIHVSNHTPYYLSVVSAKMNCSGSTTPLTVSMLAPQSADIHWAGRIGAHAGCVINYVYINDYGGRVTADKKIQ